jgi:hypothetical protein
MERYVSRLHNNREKEMMRKGHRLGLAFALLCGAFGPAAARDLQVVGLDGRSVSLPPDQIAALPHVATSVTVEGKTAGYRGVLLSDILARVDAPLGKALRGAELRDVVLVTAADAYGAVFALAEADPSVRGEKIILADEADGRPLAESQGPYRIVVEGDRRGARMVRMVTAIEVRRLAPRP